MLCDPLGHATPNPYRIAGSETTSTSLSYFFWELSRRADVMQRLRAELDVAMPDSGAIPDISVLHRLPYLNAFIKEGKLQGFPPIQATKGPY